LIRVVANTCVRCNSKSVLQSISQCTLSCQNGVVTFCTATFDDNFCNMKRIYMCVRVLVMNSYGVYCAW
jgi:hypothetical protein